MCLRFQPVVEEPLTFLDIKAGTKVILNSVSLYKRLLVSLGQSMHFLYVLCAPLGSRAKNLGRHEDYND